jgi:hypothetical protein
LSDEARNDLSKILYFDSNLYKKPLFNYISFCKHLNLEIIERLIEEVAITQISLNVKKIKNEILKLFINEIWNIHIFVYLKIFDYYHFIPGAELCFSGIEFLKCNYRINDKFLSLLTKVSKSIKELKFVTYDYDYNYGITPVN